MGTSEPEGQEKNGSRVIFSEDAKVTRRGTTGYAHRTQLFTHAHILPQAETVCQPHTRGRTGSGLAIVIIRAHSPLARSEMSGTP